MILLFLESEEKKKKDFTELFIVDDVAEKLFNSILPNRILAKVHLAWEFSVKLLQWAQFKPISQQVVRSFVINLYIVHLDYGIYVKHSMR